MHMPTLFAAFVTMTIDNIRNSRLIHSGTSCRFLSVLVECAGLMEMDVKPAKNLPYNSRTSSIAAVVIILRTSIVREHDDSYSILFSDQDARF